MTASIGIAEILIGLGGTAALAAFITGMFQKGKVKAERQQLSAQAEQIITTAAESLVKSYQKANLDLQTELAATKTELSTTRRDLGMAQRELNRNSAQLRETNRRLNVAIDLLENMGADVTTILHRGDAQAERDEQQDEYERGDN